MIQTDTRGGVVTLTIDRVARKNALTRDMYTAMAQVLEAAAVDDALRVVCIAGHTSCFSAGNDMVDFLQMTSGGPIALSDQPVFRFLLALHRCPKPVLAGVCGPAVGIGTTLLLHCDHVVASRDAKFSTPFVGLGLCSEAAASVLLPRLVGPRVAQAMLLLGQVLPAAQALQSGLVSELVDADEVAVRLAAVADELAAKPSQALQASKALMKFDHATVESVMAQEAEAFARLLAGPAAKEAFAAFMAKRQPDFSNC